MFGGSPRRKIKRTAEKSSTRPINVFKIEAGQLQITAEIRGWN